jgi:hypothetical protein
LGEGGSVQPEAGNPEPICGETGEIIGQKARFALNATRLAARNELRHELAQFGQPKDTPAQATKACSAVAAQHEQLAEQSIWKNN